MEPQRAGPTSNPQPDPELTEEPETVRAKAMQLAELIRNAKGRVALMTGAGISTSAGIPDYRGPDGVWTCRGQVSSCGMGICPYVGMQGREAPSWPQLVQPTVGHMAFVALEKAGFISFIASQNVDGLHRQSGFPPRKLAELHGNMYVDRCAKCGMENFRPFSVRISRSVTGHGTGRTCEVEGCDGELVDTIVNFGEGLQPSVLEAAHNAFATANVGIAMGTSLRVSPACELPFLAKKSVVINLQGTPKDKEATLVIHGRTDTVMELVCEELGVVIEDPPPIERRARPDVEEKNPIVDPDDPFVPPTGVFQVKPKEDCPHVNQLLAPSDMTTIEVFERQRALTSALEGPDKRGKQGLTVPCSVCGDVRENWLCVGCGSLNCSRYVRSHASAHAHDQDEVRDGHCIGISLADLSVWCYSCDSYIVSEEIRPVLMRVHKAKFGEE